MKDLLGMTIQIADSNNNVLLDCQAGEKEVIVNENLQIVTFTPEVLQLKVKDFHIKTDVSFKGFPIWEPTPNTYGIPKAMWNKLVKSGTAKMYNDMVECLSEVSEWHSPDNGETTWETSVVAHNAAILFLSTKFQKYCIPKKK